jgi:hypothetical protein
LEGNRFLDIVICQTCGFILRGKGKFCTGCGAPVTQFSPTVLPVYGSSAAPAALVMSADPLVLERVIVQKSLSKQNGNGGNGDHQTSSTSIFESSNVAAGSILGNLLSPATTGSSLPPGNLGNDLLSFESSPPPQEQLASEPPMSPAFDPVAPSVAEAQQAESTVTATTQPALEPAVPAASLPPSPVPTVLPVTEPSLVQPPESSFYEAPESPQNMEFFADQPEPPVSASLETQAGFVAQPENQLQRDVTPAAPAQPSAASTPTSSNASSFDFFASEPISWESASAADSEAPPPDIPQPATPPSSSTATDFFPNATTDPFSRFDEPSLPPQIIAPLSTVQADNSVRIEDTVPSAATGSALPGFPTPANNTSPSPAPVDEEGYPDESVKRGRQWSETRDTSQEVTTKPAAKQNSETISDNRAIAILQQALKHLEGEVDIAGHTLSKKYLAIAAIMAVFFGFQLFGAVGRIFSASPADTASKIPSIAGQWDMAYKYKGQIVQCDLEIYQSGNSIEGEGQDGKYFQIRGTYKPPNIEFNKQYVDATTNKFLGQPVLYSGTVRTDYTDRYPTMTGVYATPVKVGYYYNSHIEQYKEIWDASMSAPSKSAGTAPITTDVARKDPKEFQNKLFMIAVGFLGLGLLVVLGSLKLFGPSGLVNIWSKREYIPSQFKSQHAKMLRELGKPAKPGGLPLGKREDWNILQFDKPRELALTPELRDANPHVLVLGAGAKGKSRYIAHLVAHDIECNERALVVIDSDGTLIDLIVRWIASHPKGSKYAKRTIIIDPTHKGGCPAYNPLELPDDGDLQAAASAVVFGFKAIYTEPPGAQSQWNQQTANILRNSAQLLMVNGKTLVDLPTLLSDNDFRDVLLDKVEKRKDERVEFITLLETWGQYKRLARTDQWITWVEPILNRVSPMLSDPRIRPILTKAKGDLNLRDLITNNKILLVKIPQGQLDQNANLLGSLLVTGLKQSALAIATGTGRKHPCTLYLDEFDNFIEKETVDSLTSETKKFQIGMVAAIKTLQHLPEDFRNQLIINMGTMCAFALAKKDGDMLGPQMFRVDGRKIKHQTLQNLFNRVNTSPQFELISDEEKLNIDRVVGQEEKTFYCYRVGTIAGVFHMKSHDFPDIQDKDIHWSLIDEMYAANVKTDA